MSNAAARRFTGDKLVLATHNKGKVLEIGALLAAQHIEVLSMNDLNLPEPDETGDTFAANAILKARAAASASQLPALADDSGLAVNALNGAPGIYSARWAGPGKDFQKAMARVHEELEKSAAADRAAAFLCVLALAWPDGHVEMFEGRIDGTIVWPPRGDHGFGYDPMFVPGGHDQTFGEMPPDAKRAISHRTRAFEKMLDGGFR